MLLIELNPRKGIRNQILTSIGVIIVSLRKYTQWLRLMMNSSADLRSYLFLSFTSLFNYLTNVVGC